MNDDSDQPTPPDPPNADDGRLLPFPPRTEEMAAEVRPCPWAKDADDFYIDPSTGLRACGARKARGPGWCVKSPKRGAKRCYKHGGASHRGEKVHSYTNGMRSKYMPADVRKKVDEAARDENLLELRADVAIYDAHIAELFSSMKTGESGAAWEEMKELSAQLSGSSAELDAAVRSGDAAMFRSAADSIAAAARAVRGVVEKGLGRQETWEQIHAAQEGRIKATAADWKRQELLKHLLPAEQAMNLVMAIMHSVKRNCRDVRAQEQIAYDIGSYINAVQAQKRPIKDGETIIDS